MGNPRSPPFGCQSWFDHLKKVRKEHPNLSDIEVKKSSNKII